MLIFNSTMAGNGVIIFGKTYLRFTSQRSVRGRKFMTLPDGQFDRCLSLTTSFKTFTSCVKQVDRGVFVLQVVDNDVFYELVGPGRNGPDHIN